MAPSKRCKGPLEGAGWGAGWLGRRNCGVQLLPSSRSGPWPNLTVSTHSLLNSPGFAQEGPHLLSKYCPDNSAIQAFFGFLVFLLFFVFFFFFAVLRTSQ